MKNGVLSTRTADQDDGPGNAFAQPFWGAGYLRSLKFTVDGRFREDNAANGDGSLQTRRGIGV